MSALAHLGDPTDARQPLPWELRNWRVTTAARVFTLALALGLATTDLALPSLATPFLTLCALAAIMSGLHMTHSLGWAAPVAEGAVVALILSTAGNPDALLVSLTVAPLVAGMTFGAAVAWATVGAQVATVVGAGLASQRADLVVADLQVVAPYVLGGLGIGLLGAWSRASARQQEAERAPYAAAHRLLAELRTVSRKLQAGLDTHTLGHDLLARVQAGLGADRAWLLVQTDSGELTQLTQRGVPDADPISNPVADPNANLAADPAVLACADAESAQQRPLSRTAPRVAQRVALPVRVGSRLIGVIVADRPNPAAADLLAAVEAGLEELSLRFDTALLFDEVRSVATVEERQRLAREIHDGVAQEIASMGYLVDDIAAAGNPGAARRAAAELRGELSRVVGELRHSIFDLRTSIDEDAGLGRALTTYVREVGARADLQVHLTLQERPPRLRVETETELLRIAQEAVTNARKHAQADNLWVRLDTDSPSAVLRIEDDGVGAAHVRDHHYGLRIMRERAARVGASLTITERAGGGTVVEARIPAVTPHPQGVRNVHHSAAGR
ncbi:MAG: GAF domain-containing protein [Propionibacteriales bacterium]|nr:GAF domain-containing protein [Propionibacteriales bacterium]